jgi:hypothetical protein
MAKRHYESETEKHNFGMLGYDHGEVANMPQAVKYHEWPSSEKYLDEALPANTDNIIGVDRQMSEDVRGAKKHRSNKKY